MNVRRPTEADAPVVTELIAAMDTHFVGAPELTEEDLQDEWNDLELDRDAWLFELDGELAGYSVLPLGRTCSRTATSIRGTSAAA